MTRIEKLGESEVHRRVAERPGWTIENGKLTKTFQFKSFMQGIAFVNQVAAVAEEMDHHPDIAIRFGLITIALTTHEARGITERDFAQAARLDAL